MPSPPSELTTSAKDSKVSYEILDAKDELIGVIDGVSGGSLEWSANTSVHVSGAMDVDDITDIDWLNTRVRIKRAVNGLTWSRGIFIPSAPQEAWRYGHRSWRVELLGKLGLLQQDKRGTWSGIPAGVNAIATVKQELQAAGHTKISIPDSSLVLKSSLTFEPNTSLLTRVNAVLNAVGFWALDADEEGYFTSSPYRAPSERPVKWDLLDDDHGIVQDLFTVDRDVYAIPNRVVVVGVTEGENPPLIGTAENTNPASRFSIPGRGGLIIPWSPETLSDAATQSLIDAEAKRWLEEKSSVTATAPIRHAVIPLKPNERVWWRNASAEIDTTWAVQAITEPLNSHDDMTTTLREVVEL